ncbi:flagellar hook protein FlgE [Thermomicrobium roseum]|uniref:Flagellar hook protein FlgE n=1 Tax=Thermomicrobium roseum (strain ATCC 27502 / DSM 5159 / P-2) TaxID=309801 RepID=B9L4C8_THERP|nr:flagellar hook protein FlgE [Thermomicrobium roseum]ACM06412.1 flagellar hook protein FlgE [Thermomicrobium roseum DSM 5159]
MMRSMFSAISGLRAHQTWMDVIGNNIANVNTTGFKVGRVRFTDILSQLVRGASGPTETRGGINPLQIGLGAVVGAVDTIHTQGALQLTGKPSDLAIQGDGFFVVSDGSQTLYTRDGAFDIGSDLRLVNPSNGFYVLGWQADANGNVDTAGPVGPITIPIGQQLDAVPTTQITVQGNLNANQDPAATPHFVTKVSITDSLGKRHEFYILFDKVGTNTWNYTLQEDDPRTTSTTEDDPDFALGGTPSGTLVFDADGNLDLAASNISAVDLDSTAGGASSITVTPDFSRLTQLAAPYSANAAANGAPAGSLTTFTVSQSGQVLGIYSNGVTKVVGQIALALFTNPGGLMKVGGNAYLPTVNSGEPIVGPADSGGRGKIASGYLEMSNVDLAQEFTSMIMAQRGFQANSRVITTSDEVLQELVNLRR